MKKYKEFHRIAEVSKEFNKPIDFFLKKNFIGNELPIYTYLPNYPIVEGIYNHDDLPKNGNFGLILEDDFWSESHKVTRKMSGHPKTSGFGFGKILDDRKKINALDIYTQPNSYFLHPKASIEEQIECLVAEAYWETEIYAYHEDQICLSFRFPEDKKIKVLRQNQDYTLISRDFITQRAIKNNSKMNRYDVDINKYAKRLFENVKNRDNEKLLQAIKQFDPALHRMQLLRLFSRAKNEIMGYLKNFLKTKKTKVDRTILTDFIEALENTFNAEIPHNFFSGTFIIERKINVQDINFSLSNGYQILEPETIHELWATKNPQIVEYLEPKESKYFKCLIPYERKLPTVTIDDLFITEEDKNRVLLTNVTNDNETPKKRDIRYQKIYTEMLKENKKITQNEAAYIIYEKEEKAGNKPPKQSYIQKMLVKEKAEETLKIEKSK